MFKNAQTNNFSGLARKLGSQNSRFFPGLLYLLKVYTQKTVIRFQGFSHEIWAKKCQIEAIDDHYKPHKLQLLPSIPSMDAQIPMFFSFEQL